MNEVEAVTDREFVYDVAISFLETDVDTGKRIYEGLRDRLRVFFYPACQDVLAGRPATEVFPRIFGREARLVIVLYREGWGETPFTSLEYRALEERSFRERGYDKFALVLTVGEKREAPDWLPPHLLRLDPFRFGIETAITIIEERLRTLGLEVIPESAAQIAAGLNRQLEWDSTKRGRLNCHGGVRRTEAFVKELLSLIVSKVQIINEQSSMLPLQVSASREVPPAVALAIYLPNGPLEVTGIWHCGVANSLREAAFTVTMYAKPPTHEMRRSEPSRELASRAFLVDLVEPDQLVWREEQEKRTRSPQRLFANDDLGEEFLSWLLRSYELSLETGITQEKS